MTAKNQKPVRVRFAPSPTGPFHIGNLRTALFNHLFSKKNNGVFVLRIEDTDQERSEKKWEQGIMDSLQWLDIKVDEGPIYQSQRKEIYQKYIKKLIDEKKVYYCFCTKEELEAQKQYLMSIGKPAKYDGKCRQFSEKEIEKNIKANKPFVLRLKTQPQNIIFEDGVRGKIETNADTFGDMVIAKGLDQPLYNLACVIDDYELKISHIIRGEDHIPNTPKQILIAQMLGIETPAYIHLPIILGPDKSKLSKRHGADFVPEYKEQGYLPEAMINFLALLGWNPDSDKEIFNINELIKEFSVEKIQKSGAIFNIQKLDWLNGYYVRHMDLDKLTELCLPYIKQAGFETNDFGYLKKAVGLYQERLKKLSEVGELVDFFFKEPKYDKKLLIWKDVSEKEIKVLLDKSQKLLSKIKEENWNQKTITEKLMKQADKVGDRGAVLWPLRAGLSGKKASAGVFEIADVLGKKKTLERIKQAVDLL